MNMKLSDHIYSKFRVRLMLARALASRYRLLHDCLFLLLITPGFVVLHPLSIFAAHLAEPAVAFALTPSPTPNIIIGVVNRHANLRARPGVAYKHVGTIAANTQVNIVGANASGDWYQLDTGDWIAAFLVDVINDASPLTLSAPTDFGSFMLTIAPQGTIITKIDYEFVNWQCGSMQISGGVSSSKVTGGWAIINGTFKIENMFHSLGLTIEGMFDAQGQRATGVWKASSPDEACSGQSGAWETLQSAENASNPSLTPTPLINVPVIRIPTVNAPVISIPTISIPTISIPAISIPTVSIPTVSIPTVNPPQINPPETSATALATPILEATPTPGRPLTGLIRSVFNKPGKGELRIDNGAHSDGVVVLVAVDGKPVVMAYIRTNEAFRITDIPDGEYQLFFKKGSEWDDASQEFKVMSTSQVFDDTFIFKTTATQYTIWEVTLYSTPEGQAATTKILPDLFPKLK